MLCRVRFQHDKTDKPQEIPNKVREIRELLNEIIISEKARTAFKYRLFNGEKLSSWPRSEEDKIFMRSITEL